MICITYLLFSKQNKDGAVAAIKTYSRSSLERQSTQQTNRYNFSHPSEQFRGEKISPVNNGSPTHHSYSGKV